MGQGDYTHPSYLARQHAEFGPTIAGANGTSGHAAYPSNIRLRQIIAAISVAGTVGTNVAAILQAVGTGIMQYTSTGVTTSTGTVALGTISYGTAGNTIGVIGTLADINTMIPAGSVISAKNGADATAVTNIVAEYYLDPGASWTGQN